MAVLALRLMAAVDSAAIDRLLAPYEKPDSPGCVLAVVKDGKVLYQRASGMANLEHAIPLSPRSAFEIASASKTFTALAVLIAERDGKLSLDDPVKKYIPELPDYGRPMSIRHILSHTAGLRDVVSLMVLAGRTHDDITNWPEMLAMIARQKKLNFVPGEEILYTNTGYLLAAHIIQQVTGRTLRQYADERIFGPLGMKNTHFVDDRWTTVPRRATGYSPQEGGFRASYYAAFEMTGAAGVHTTLEDMIRWDAAFFDPESKLKPLFDRMMKPVLLDNGNPAEAKLGDSPVQFGLGFLRERWGNRTVVEQAGGWAGYRSGVFRIVEDRFSVICFCNRADAYPEALGRSVVEMFYPDIKPEPEKPATAKPAAPVQIPKERLMALEGNFLCDELDAVYRLTVRDGKLHAIVGHVDLELTPESATRFRAGPFLFSVTVDGFRLDLSQPPWVVRELELRRIR